MAVLKKKQKGAATKKTSELLEKLFAYLKIGFSNEETCTLCGISKETFYDWKKKDIDFSDRINRSRLDGEAYLVSKITKHDTWQSSAWLLERTRHAKYGKKQTIIIEGNGKNL